MIVMMAMMDVGSVKRGYVIVLDAGMKRCMMSEGREERKRYDQELHMQRRKFVFVYIYRKTRVVREGEWVVRAVDGSSRPVELQRRG